MDRDILFKAKRVNWRELPKEEWWVEGYYFCMVHNDLRHAHHFIIPLGADLSLGTPIEKIQVEVIAETVCEYSGHADKSSRKIFEGDIVKDVNSGSVGIIKFGIYNAKHYGFHIEWTGNCGYRHDICYWSKNRLIRVVGNIYDNPKLLNAGQQGNQEHLQIKTGNIDASRLKAID